LLSKDGLDNFFAMRRDWQAGIVARPGRSGPAPLHLLDRMLDPGLYVLQFPAHRFVVVAATAYEAKLLAAPRHVGKGHPVKASFDLAELIGKIHCWRIIPVPGDSCQMMLPARRWPSLCPRPYNSCSRPPHTK